MLRGLAAALTIAFVVLAAPGRAEQVARLVYVRNAGAEACPDEDGLRTAVGARLGYDPFRPFAELTLLVNVDRTSGRYRGSVRLVDPRGIERGVRVLDPGATRCEDLIATLALTLSVVIDPLRQGKPGPPAVEEEPVRAPDPEPPHVEPETPRAVPETPRVAAPRVGFFVGAALLGSLGVAPAPSLGGAVFVGIRRERLSLSLEGRGDLSASDRFENARMASRLVVGSLVPCVAFGLPFLCAVASAGARTASSSGVADPESDTAFHLALGLRGGVEVPLSDAFALRAGLDLVVPIVRHPFVLDDVTVFTPFPIQATGVVGAVVRF